MRKLGLCVVSESLVNQLESESILAAAALRRRRGDCHGDRDGRLGQPQTWMLPA